MKAKKIDFEIHFDHFKLFKQAKIKRKMLIDANIT